MITISWEPMIATLKRLLPKKKGTGKQIVSVAKKIHLKSLIVRNSKPTFPSQWPCFHLPNANTISESESEKWIMSWGSHDFNGVTSKCLSWPVRVVVFYDNEASLYQLDISLLSICWMSCKKDIVFWESQVALNGSDIQSPISIGISVHGEIVP